MEFLIQNKSRSRHHYNSCNSSALSWVDKVTTGAQTFISVITNVPAPVQLVKMLLNDQIKMRLALQLISGISRVLQKLLKHFNSTAISTSFELPLLGYSC